MNRTCSHCRRELRSDAAYLNYCNDDCRRLYPDRLTRTFVPAHARRRVEARQQQPRPRGEAALLADRAAGSRNTMSVSAGWVAIGNEAGTYQPFFDKYEPSRGNL